MYYEVGVQTSQKKVFFIFRFFKTVFKMDNNNLCQ